MMKRKKLYFALGLACILPLLALVTWADIPNTDSQHFEFQGEKNLLKNPGCENGAADWTPTDSDEIAVRTTDPGYGLRSCIWDPDQTTDTLSSSSASVPNGIALKRCKASAKYKYPSGNYGDITLEVIQDGNSVLASGSLLANSLWQSADFEFTCPAQGSTLELVFDANIAASGSLFIDQAFLGKIADDRQLINLQNQRMVYGAATFYNNGGSACQVLKQNGSLFENSVIANGTGDCTYKFISDAFTSEPNCICTGRENAAVFCVLHSDPTTRNIRILTKLHDGTARDTVAQIFCVGQTNK